MIAICRHAHAHAVRCSQAGPRCWQEASKGANQDDSHMVMPNPQPPCSSLQRRGGNGAMKCLVATIALMPMLCPQRMAFQNTDSLRRIGEASFLERGVAAKAPCIKRAGTITVTPRVYPLFQLVQSEAWPSTVEKCLGLEPGSHAACKPVAPGLTPPRRSRTTVVTEPSTPSNDREALLFVGTVDASIASARRASHLSANLPFATAVNFAMVQHVPSAPLSPPTTTPSSQSRLLLMMQK